MNEKNVWASPQRSEERTMREASRERKRDMGGRAIDGAHARSLDMDIVGG